jgi:hypothetical protein
VIAESVSNIRELLLRAVPFLGASAIGAFLLNEISRRLAATAEDRKHLGCALSELLELRSRMAMMKVVREQLEAAFGGPLPPEVMPAMYMILPKIMPDDWNDFRLRYNSALTDIAGVRPVLAYNLRSKDIVAPFLERLGTAATQDAHIAQAGSWLDKMVTTQGLPVLSDGILALARKHGLKTWWEARTALKRQDVLPRDIADAVAAMMKSLMESQAKSQSAE